MAKFAGDRTGVDFQPIQLASGASGGNYSAAASAVDLGNSFSAMRDKVRYDALSGEAMKNQSAETIAGMEAEASVMSAGMTAYGNTSSAALQARGQIEAAERAAEIAAEAQSKSSLIGGISGVVGTGLKLLTGGLA